jgi:hypothetical protein
VTEITFGHLFFDENRDVRGLVERNRSGAVRRPENRDIFLEGAPTITFWRFKACYPGLIDPRGVRLPPQQ